MPQQALALDALTELGFKDGWLSRAASFLILGQTHRFEMLQTEGYDHCEATTLVKHTVVQHSQHQSWSHCEDLSHKILDRTLLKKRGDVLVCLFVWLVGWLVVWLFSCLVVWLFGCLFVCF